MAFLQKTKKISGGWLDPENTSDYNLSSDEILKMKKVIKVIKNY